jgi:hypothetical protein
VAPAARRYDIVKQEDLMTKKMLLAAFILLPALALASQRVMVCEEMTKVSG